MNTLARLFDRLFRIEFWNLGIAEIDLAEFVATGQLGPVQWCPVRSRGTFRADPFFWNAPDGLRVIYEEFHYWRARAILASVDLDGLLEGAPARVELSLPHHLSYPGLVRHDNVWYCLPECAESGGIDLYVWLDAERRWHHSQRLVDDVAALDPTALHHDGLWYLFATDRHDGANEKLRIWWAPTLEGPWHQHASNPVKTSAASARPAGPLFRFAGELYRPAQNATQGYGSSISLNRIDRLTPTEFSESTVCEVLPDRAGEYPLGLHTVSIHGNRAVIDGKTRRFHPLASLLKLSWTLQSARRGRHARRLIS